MNGNIESIDRLIAEIEEKSVGLQGDPAKDAVAAIKRVWAVAYLKGLRHGVVHGLGGIADAEMIAMAQLDYMATDREKPPPQVGDAGSLFSVSPSVAKIDMQPRTQRGMHDALVLKIVHAHAESGITYHYTCVAARKMGILLSDSTVRKVLPRLERQGMVSQREGLWYPAGNIDMPSQQQLSVSPP